MWQANHVRDALRARWGEDLVVELVEITTEGDRILDRPLNEVGGKGLFVKGIEEPLLRGEIDLAVHSMKDLPGHLPEGLTIICTPERADPRDVLVGPEGATLATLARGTRLGSSSLRRGALARRINPGLEIISIRGNVASRISKIAAGVVDVVLLAAAGLDRLGHTDLIRERIDIDAMCPAACQGILAIEIRESDTELAELLAPLNHAPTQTLAAAERAFLIRLEGGCQVPMACHATLVDDQLHVRGLVVDPSGEPIYEARASGPSEQAAELGRGLAETLLGMGAGDVFERLAQR